MQSTVYRGWEEQSAEENDEREEAEEEARGGNDNEEEDGDQQEPAKENDGNISEAMETVRAMQVDGAGGVEEGQTENKCMLILASVYLIITGTI